MKRFREKLRSREALAIRADVDLLALLCELPPPTEVIDGIGILHVRGPLENHDTGLSDSYERIVREFRELNDDDEVVAIVMCIDSPGGLVAGLNSTVRSLRSAKTKPVYAWGEMATSAAYALACAADDICLSPSSIMGSVGVISTLGSQVRANEKAGLDYVTITSGARKADGHPNVPIDDGAIVAEELRVDKLALQFYRLVQESRGLSPKYLRSLEAGIYLGQEAVDVGLADDVLDFDEVLDAIRLTHGLDHVGSVESTRSPSPYVTSEEPMLKTRAQIAKLQKKLVASGSKSERRSISEKITKLLATLPMAGTKTTKYRLEEEESTESDEEDEEEEEGGNETDREEEGDDEKKEASAAEEEEEASAESEDEDEKKAEADDKDDAPPEKKEKKAAKAFLRTLGVKSFSAARGKVDALVALATRTAAVEKELHAIKAKAAGDRRAEVIRDAQRSNRITPAEAKTLAGKPMEYIEAYLDGRPAARVLTAEQALRPLPKGSAQVAEESGSNPEATVSLTEDQEKMLADVSDPKLRAQIVANWKARLNGAAREA